MIRITHIKATTGKDLHGGDQVDIRGLPFWIRLVFLELYLSCFLSPGSV